MNPRQIQLVQASFTKVTPNADKTVELFYQHLFELDPSIMRMFRSDMKGQGRKLMQTLSLLVNGLHNLDAVTPAAQDLARRHVSYGVQPGQYETLGQALIWALDQSLGAEFTPETKTAWENAYEIFSNLMKNTSYQ